MNKRFWSVLVVLALALAVLASCAAPTNTPGPTATPTPDISKVSLPLADTVQTFKAFLAINESAQDYKDNVVWKKVAELTNVQLDFTSVLSSNYTTEFNLMLAAKTYPDLFAYPSGSGSVNYTGGLEQAVDDGVALDVKPLLATDAPLYWSLLNKPEILRDIQTDKGYIPGVYQVTELTNDKPAFVWGMMIRKDWLDTDGLTMPTTIDEWHTVLTAFKDKNGATFPLLKHLGDNPIFMQAYGIVANPANQFGSGVGLFYPDTSGKIHYGGVEQGYADYLKTLSAWYAEGLYDRDFDTRGIYDLPGEAALVGTGKAGATGGYLAWKGMFYGAASTQTGFAWVAAPAPKLTATSDLPSEQVTFPKYVSDPWVITKACKNPDLLLKLFNWMCTDQGQLLMNWGVEGDSYTMVNGKPQFTDKILKSDKGASAYLEIYNGNFAPLKLEHGPVQSAQLIDAATTTEQNVQVDSVNTVYLTWQLTADESTQVNAIMSDIQTYIQEQYALAVKSPTVAAGWMATQAAQIKSMGIDNAITIMQTAYDRYMAKK